MRPFVVTLPGKVCGVTPVAEGYAVTHEKGIELLSPDLARVGAMPAAPGVRELWGDTLRELPDGRVIACSRSGIGYLFVGRRGGMMEPLLEDHGYVLPPLLTPTGFVAAQCRDQAAEQVAGVVRPGARFREVLHAEHPPAAQAQTLDGLIVYVDVCALEVGA